MGKLGKEYERAVAAVAAAFDQESKIEVGKWVIGPDGRREIDVFITGTHRGANHRILVECKDFNPKTTGPVGISYLDELDSKRHDLDITSAIICCSSGFTREAISKARRKGIGAIAVMKKGDPRLRHKVIDEVYFRKVQITASNVQMQGVKGVPAKIGPLELLHDGKPVARWVHFRASQILQFNPIVTGTVSQSLTFTEPLQFTWEGGEAKLTNLEISFSVKGSWYSYQTEINSGTGIYNWARKRILLAPGENHITYGGIDFDKGVKIASIPEFSGFNTKPVDLELHLEFLVVDGIFDFADRPDIESFLIPEDRSFLIPDMHDPRSECYREARL